MEDCIKILDLPDEFDLKILKKSYRKLVMKYHPDKATNEEEREAFEVMMKLINASYEQVKEYLETHGGKYSKPKENNSSSYNSYNSAKTEEKATDSNDTKTKEETYKQKKEKSDKEREEYIKKRVKEYEDFIKRMSEEREAEREKERAKEEEFKQTESTKEKTSYYQEQTYDDNSFADKENYEKEDSCGNYAEDENVEMSFDELFVVLKIYFWQLQRAILYKPKKVVLLALGLVVAFIIIDKTIMIDFLYNVYMIGIIAFVCLKVVKTRNNAIKESGNVINHLKKIREEVEEEKSNRRLEKMVAKHNAEREKIERERMRKFEEEWERKHPEENTTKKSKTNTKTKDAWSTWKNLRDR